MTRGFLGGLRAQIVAGLTAMLLVTFALGGLVVESMMTRRLLDERHRTAAAIARIVASDSNPRQLEEIARAAGTGGVLVESPSLQEAFGSEAILARLRESPPADGATISIDGRRYVIARAQEGGARVTVATEVDSISDVVAQTRGNLAVFVVLVALFVLAFGVAFLTYVVIRPIRAIGIATERAAQGDLASPITVIPRNEYGRVAESFNLMLSRLDRNRAQLEEKVRELERTNRELEATRDSLVRSEKLASVGQLAAGIAHEIGNPLAAVSGYNELLADGDLDEEQRDDVLARSATQLERIRGVIRNLLDFSRDDGAGEPQPTDLSRSMSESLSLIRALPRSRGVDIVVENMAGPPVLAIPSQVTQVLVNLCMNALDALGGVEPAAARLGIARVDHPDRVELVIEDSGPGIPPELRGRIFDPFFTTKEPGQGTGLGLAICARIMESFGGDVHVESADGGGARFVLVFRRWEDAG